MTALAGSGPTNAPRGSRESSGLGVDVGLGGANPEMVGVGPVAGVPVGLGGRVSVGADTDVEMGDGVSTGEVSGVLVAQADSTSMPSTNARHARDDLIRPKLR